MVTGSTQAVAGRAGAAGGGGGRRAAGPRRSGDAGSAGSWIILVALLVVLAVIAFFLVQCAGQGTSTSPSPAWRARRCRPPRRPCRTTTSSVGSTSSKTSTSAAKGEVISTDPGGGRQGGQEQPGRPGRQRRRRRDHGDRCRRWWASSSPRRSSPQQRRAVVQDRRTSPAPSRRARCSTQDPAGGTSVKSTTVVKLTVSSSQSSISVPNVVGFSQTIAGSTINGSNLTRRDPDVGLFAAGVHRQRRLPDPGRRDPGQAAGDADQSGRVQRPLLGHRARRDPGDPERGECGHHRRRPA